MRRRVGYATIIPPPLLCCPMESCSSPRRYTNSTQNDLAYWGLDYPPLSAYQVGCPGMCHMITWSATHRLPPSKPTLPHTAQSWVHGKVLQRWVPEAVALGSSRGIETPRSKLALRQTVLASDLAVYFPAAAFLALTLHGARLSRQAITTLAQLLLGPGLILIDHGHFQFNCINLGLTVRQFDGRVWHGPGLMWLWTECVPSPNSTAVTTQACTPHGEKGALPGASSPLNPLHHRSWRLWHARCEAASLPEPPYSVPH